MKSIVMIFTILSITLFALGYSSKGRSCVVDADCDDDKCCITESPGKTKTCKDMGDEVGKPCGGKFSCNRCGKNMECVNFPEQVVDGYFNSTLPVNGTCQLPLTKYPPVVHSRTLVSYLNASIPHNKTLPVPIRKPTKP